MRPLKLFFSTVAFVTFTLAVVVADEITIKTESVKVGGHNIYYNTAGEGDNTILFLHGLFANKEQWQQLMVYFAEKGYYTVAPDLPGYGQSNEFPMKVYSMQEQVKLLDEFINKIGLKKINIAGNSLGCTVALSYTKKYPEKILTVALLGGPAGLGRWHSKMLDDLGNSQNPFIPLAVKEFYLEMELLFYKAPEIPIEVAKKSVAYYKKNYKKFTAVFNLFNLTIYNFSINYKADFVKPVLIVWGEEDYIMTVDDAEIAQKKIPGSKLVKLKDAGHLLMIENADATADEYNKFLNDNK